jgi:hypothetical protein
MLYQLSYALRPHYQVSTFQQLEFHGQARQSGPYPSQHLLNKPFISNPEPSLAGSHLSRTTVSLT